MRIGKRHPLRRQPIQIRRLDLPSQRVETLHIAITEIIAKNVNNVGLPSRHFTREQLSQQSQQQGSDGNKMHELLRSKPRP